MTDVVGNPEEERKAEYFYEPWINEGVNRYFYSLVWILVKLIIFTLFFELQKYYELFIMSAILVLWKCESNLEILVMDCFHSGGGPNWKIGVHIFSASYSGIESHQHWTYLSFSQIKGDRRYSLWTKASSLLLPSFLLWYASEECCRWPSENNGK